MKRVETIKEKKEFSAIINNGQYKKNKYYYIYIMKSNMENSKYGIAISNKVGKAHIRNKLKRQTRTLIDKYRNLFKKGHNYIIMIRKATLDTNFNTLETNFYELLKD